MRKMHSLMSAAALRRAAIGGALAVSAIAALVAGLAFRDQTHLTPPRRPTTARVTYSTDFPRTESPISEGGAWHHLGTSWTFVQTLDRRAVGTQTGVNGYDDSYAYLSGFGPDQMAEATLWLNPAISGDYREGELLLRWSDTPTTARGYECNIAWNGAYAQIVRWDGGYGKFTYIANQTRFARGVMPPRTGDVFKAMILGSSIYVYINKNDGNGDRLIVTGRDETYASGNPGLGFFVQGARYPAQFGFSSYTASSY